MMCVALLKFLLTGWSILFDAGFWTGVSLLMVGFSHSSIAQDFFKKSVDAVAFITASPPIILAVAFIFFACVSFVLFAWQSHAAVFSVGSGLEADKALMDSVSLGSSASGQMFLMALWGRHA